MKSIFSFITIFAFQLSVAQEKPKTLSFKEFGWTISIPSDYKKAATDQEDMLFYLEKDPSHNFQAYWEDFDESKDGNYVEALRSAKNEVNNVVNEQLPNSGTVSESEEVVSGKKFTVFTSKVTVDKEYSLTTVTYARVFNKKALSVNMTFSDAAEGQKLISAFKNSTFK